MRLCQSKTNFSDFESLQIVNLRLQNVRSPGEPMQLKNLCPSIRELDISKNLLCSWLDIFDICIQLEQLEWLNVNENILSLPENYTDYSFPNIKTLICGYMNLKWSDILKLSIVFPNVEELRVPYNEITALSVPLRHNFKKLKTLDLEGNSIGDWSEIMKLSVISNLQQLNLENIKLKEILFDENLEVYPNFTKINISNNVIENWRSVGELNKLPILEELRLAKNPVLDLENLATREALITARIASLKVLNGRPISSDERRGAEIDYIKKYGLEWLKCKNTPLERQFVLMHNRYLELIQKYGCPEERELLIQPNILKTALVSLNLTYNNKTITKKLPPTILVQKLIMMVEKLFKLSERPRLKYVSGLRKEIEIDLDDEMKEIGYYSIQEGDNIIVLT
ncbi:unnamed protein product [Brassicogethes aeneus]|uniref:Tubulin-specific chaperone E n=1 Tax=Brassicogethes aeneus TaxID=1431903 RepID=A0A9P0AQC2_BRAAE|nr:unnamed protein product [Brassicogethes aeneus]